MSDELTFPTLPTAREEVVLSDYEKRTELLFFRLRWLIIGTQTFAILIVLLFLSKQLVWKEAALILLVQALTNVLAPKIRQGKRQPNLVFALSLFDAASLTALLLLTGGPSNPFSVLYFVQIAIAAVLFSPGKAWLIAGLSTAGFALSFFLHVPLPPELGGHGSHGNHASHATQDLNASSGSDHRKHDPETHRKWLEIQQKNQNLKSKVDAPAQAFNVHLHGMGFAFAVAVAALVLLVGRLSKELKLEREERARTARLLGLATVAAGAAHEIGNPMATIQLAADDLCLGLKRTPGTEALFEDAQLIVEQIGRIRKVLAGMSVAAGELVGEGLSELTLQEFVEQLEVMNEKGGAVFLFQANAFKTSVYWPTKTILSAISQLLRNAIEFNRGENPVELTLTVHLGEVGIEIRDYGAGMPDAVLQRIGEPFFSNRVGGTGLGVFVARTAIEGMGGSLLFKSQLGIGTVVDVRLPRRTI